MMSGAWHRGAALEAWAPATRMVPTILITGGKGARGFVTEATVVVYQLIRAGWSDTPGDVRDC